MLQQRNGFVLEIFLWQPLFARQATRFYRRDKPHKLKLVWFCATQFFTRGDFLVRPIAGAPTCCSYLSLDLCRRSGFSSRFVAATCRQCVPTFKRLVCENIYYKDEKVTFYSVSPSHDLSVSLLVSGRYFRFNRLEFFSAFIFDQLVGFY